MANSSDEITKLMNNYKTRLSMQDTADEMNQNTQHLYMYDYIYLLSKTILFIILAIMYYLWVGKKEVTDAYVNTKDSVAKATEKIKEIPAIKAALPVKTETSG
jgi:hypothetical protein